MAWEDRTTFDAIKFQFGLSEQQVIAFMRIEMKPKSFKHWRKIQGRKTKHSKLRGFEKGGSMYPTTTDLEQLYFKKVKQCFVLSLEYLKTALKKDRL